MREEVLGQHEERGPGQGGREMWSAEIDRMVAGSSISGHYV